MKCGTSERLVSDVSRKYVNPPAGPNLYSTCIWHDDNDQAHEIRSEYDDNGRLVWTADLPGTNDDEICPNADGLLIGPGWNNFHEPSGRIETEDQILARETAEKTEAELQYDSPVSIKGNPLEIGRALQVEDDHVLIHWNDGTENWYPLATVEVRS